MSSVQKEMINQRELVFRMKGRKLTVHEKLHSEIILTKLSVFLPPPAGKEKCCC